MKVVSLLHYKFNRTQEPKFKLGAIKASTIENQVALDKALSQYEKISGELRILEILQLQKESVK